MIINRSATVSIFFEGDANYDATLLPLQTVHTPPLSVTNRFKSRCYLISKDPPSTGDKALGPVQTGSMAMLSLLTSYIDCVSFAQYYIHPSLHINAPFNHSRYSDLQPSESAMQILENLFAKFLIRAMYRIQYMHSTQTHTLQVCTRRSADTSFTPLLSPRST